MQPKKFPLPSMHIKVDDLIPATDAEKEYMVQMRPSSTFLKDGNNNRYKIYCIIAIRITAITSFATILSTVLSNILNSVLKLV